MLRELHLKPFSRHPGCWYSVELLRAGGHTNRVTAGSDAEAPVTVTRRASLCIFCLLRSRGPRGMLLDRSAPLGFSCLFRACPGGIGGRARFWTGPSLQLQTQREAGLLSMERLPDLQPLHFNIVTFAGELIESQRP